MANKQRSTALYKNPFSKAYWRDAASELKSVRILAVAALMIALRVAMKGLFIPLGPTLRINTAFVVNALGAMIFGPVVAIPAAVISDFLGWVFFPSGPYFLPYVLTEVAGSVIFALFLYRAKVTPMRVMLSRFCIDFFVNIVLNAPIALMYYKFVLGKSYLMFQVPHMLKELFMFPVESVVLTLFLSALIPLTNRFGLTHTGCGEACSEKLRFNKKEWITMACVFVIGAVSVGAFMNYYYNNNSVSGSYSASDRYAINCSMNDIVLDETDDWDEDVTVSVVESAYKKIFGGYTTYNVALYTVDEEILAANAAEKLETDPKAKYDLDTLRGYSKSPASKDTAMTRVATFVIQVNDKTGEVMRFELSE